MSAYVKQDLYELIKDLFQIKSVPPMIVKQINNYILDYGMNFKEIARCLVYWVEVRHQTLDSKFGIGIVPNIREEAAKYFKKLEIEKAEKEKAAQRAVEIQDNNIIFNIKSVKSQKRKVKQLDLTEINLGDIDDDR